MAPDRTGPTTHRNLHLIETAGVTIARMPPSELLLSLLAKRGIVDIDSFLNPSYEEHLHDPMLLSDMDKAIARF